MQTVQQERPVHLLTGTGKHSGCTVQDGVLYRRARGSQHMLRKPPAWCFETNILLEASRLGVSVVQVHDVETHTTYSASLQTLLQKGIRLNRGHGEQLAVPLSCWRREDPKQPTLF